MLGLAANVLITKGFVVHESPAHAQQTGALARIIGFIYYVASLICVLSVRLGTHANLHGLAEGCFISAPCGVSARLHALLRSNLFQAHSSTNHHFRGGIPALQNHGDIANIRIVLGFPH